MKKVINDKPVDVKDAEIEPHIGSTTGASGNCNGDACSFITIGPTSTGGGLSFSNTSSRPINMVVRFAFGLGLCMGPTNFQVQPGSHSDYGNGAMCDPYDANFA